MKDSSIHFKILHFKYLPIFIREFVLIIMNWLFQGILYMDKSEKIFKISFTLVPFFILFIFSHTYFSEVFSLIFSFLVAHTLNWVFNGQIFVLLKNIQRTQTDKKIFIEYLNSLQNKADKEKSILSVAAFGSLSKTEIKVTSDLDLRIIRKTGVLNGVRACTFVFLERKWAFFNKFPLDIYLLDSTKDLSKLDEQPIVLYDSIGSLKEYYRGKVTFWK